MKFSDVRAGMTVMFNHHDSDRWAAFHEEMMRNPNYTDAESWFRREYSKFEGVPLIVTQVRTANVHGYQWETLSVRSSAGSTSLSEHWFRPDDNNAFKELNKGVRDQIKTEPRPWTRRNKNATLGELKAMPGAVDYLTAQENAMKQGFKAGRRRKTRRRRGGSMGSPDKLTVAMVTEWLEQVTKNNNQDEVLNRLVRSMSYEPSVFKRAGVKDMVVRAVRDRSEGGEVKDDVVIALNGLRFLLQRDERAAVPFDFGLDAHLARMAARPAELPVAAAPGQYDGPGLHPAAPRHGGRRR